MFRLLKYPRLNYWTCSKFGYWLTGVNKPPALSHDQWREWHKENQKRHPIRYWIAHDGLTMLQNIVNFPRDVIHTINVYIRNRFIDKIQYLHTGLIPGEYYDLDTRILHGLFNELIDFVEVEQAHLMSCYKERNYKFVKGRCQQAGLDYLDWAINLKMDESYGVPVDDKDYGKPTQQAKSARIMLELYNWWKNRDNRPDPHSLFSRENDGKYYFRKIDEVECRYDKEDTKMLIKLIKIRGSLWT
jgi:hypothetical protein